MAPVLVERASAEALVSVLSEVSRAVAGTLELREAFERVADAVGRILPFDAMGVTRLEEPDTIVLYAVAGERAEREHETTRFRRDEMSAVLWPSPLAPIRIADTERQLDPSLLLDREILAHGSRSLLFGPLLRGETLLGGLWFSSKEPHAFSEADEETIRPLADLVSLAMEHERLSSAERERRRRHQKLEALVPALAAALDVREVFDQVSAIAQDVLAHDRMAVGLLSDDRKSVEIHAYSGERVEDLPQSFPLPEEDLVKRDWDFDIVGDIEAQVDAASEKCQILRRAGIRSYLRVPIRLEGVVAGGLTFHSRTAHRYREEDVEIALRVADQVALVLSHQRLAEEARRAAQARAEALHLEEKVARLTEELEGREGFGRVIGSSKSWRDVLVQASRVAITETTVLLTGESGTGKEVISRALHRASPRAQGPFVPLNCAALPDQLLESELFGHEKGAFTGAVGAKPGRLEQAAGGTLFLDEAGEMSPIVQAKLLRVLQEREFTRLGATKTLKADVRIIAATNRELKVAMARGEFREDLYYRLSVFEIRLPPLRERTDDILPLTEAFVKEIGRAMGTPAAGISREAKDLLLAYSWPGNVRELRNALERAAIMCEGGLITATHLPIGVVASPSLPRPGSTFPVNGVDLEAIERSYVVQALQQAGNNKSKAAKLLGISRAQLYTRLERHGLV